jgi:hypothetical protein
MVYFLTIFFFYINLIHEYFIFQKQNIHDINKKKVKRILFYYNLEQVNQLNEIILIGIFFLLINASN